MGDRGNDRGGSVQLRCCSHLSCFLCANHHESLPVPYAYMRSVILAIRAYPGLKPVVANTLVPKLVEREVCTRR
jgi:hypothetical protein